MARCVTALICAFNEAGRIGEVLAALADHPLVHETVVVDDGSTDGTAQTVLGFSGVRLIRTETNLGKTAAMALGVSAIACPHVMLLDADLCGIDARAITALAEPIMTNLADVTISLRANSLPLYRMMGLDFVSGERVLPLDLLRELSPRLRSLPRWGAEAAINQAIIERQLRLKVVDWPRVSHVRKNHKISPRAAMAQEIEMISDTLDVLSPIGVVRQNLALLKLARAA